LHLFELKPADQAKQSFESVEDYLMSSVHEDELTEILILWFASSKIYMRGFEV
jgi:hypothetical protein